MKLRFILGSLLFLFPATFASAGNFDCSVVYDEFDSLMNKQFLVQPAKYVRTVKGRLSRNDYNSKQKGLFLLKSERKNLGVAVVHTNRNTWGKLLFTWGAPFESGQPSLILKDVVLFGRVLDGHVPRTLNLIKVKSSFTIDLDTGKTGVGKTTDLWFHNIDGNEMYVEAVNGASLQFPMESMCKKNP